MMSTRFLNLTDENSQAALLLLRLKSFEQQETFTNAVESEFESVVSSLKGIKKKSLIGFEGGCTLEPAELIESIISTMRSTRIASELAHIGLRLLRKIIETEHPKLMTPSCEWQTKDWILYEESIIEQ